MMILVLKSNYPSLYLHISFRAKS